MDLREVRRIIELVENSAIDELEIEESGTRIRVRKGSPIQSGATPEAISGEAPARLAHRSGEAQPAVESGPSVVLEGAGPTIDSPMVGTFYRSPSPEAAPFVQIGSEVDEETVVCILEAMKVMNEIKAGRRGNIVEVLAENGQPVEFGQPLFKLAPA
jgi:acetyl-CoA carboxylase biotin carboxyl carrier protein